MLCRLVFERSALLQCFLSAYYQLHTVSQSKLGE